MCDMLAGGTPKCDMIYLALFDLGKRRVQSLCDCTDCQSVCGRNGVVRNTVVARFGILSNSASTWSRAPGRVVEWLYESIPNRPLDREIPTPCQVRFRSGQQPR